MQGVKLLFYPPKPRAYVGCNLLTEVPGADRRTSRQSYEKTYEDLHPYHRLSGCPQRFFRQYASGRRLYARQPPATWQIDWCDATLGYIGDTPVRCLATLLPKSVTEEAKLI